MSNQSYGPVNFERGPAGSPFSSFDNRINYTDMVGYTAAQQYYQNTISPHQLAASQQRVVATAPQFQYGVPGGQDRRTYQREAEMRRSSFTAIGLNTAMDLAAFEATSAGLGYLAPGLTAGIGGMALTAGVAMAAVAPLAYGINRANQRRQNVHSMAMDIDRYRGRLGFNSNISYGQATALSGSLLNDMGGGFFNTGQQTQIHKIALANDMMSAQGGGANSGSINQYKKNFEELKDTTEEVVKLLQTTIEGGMSVIKELQGSGFNSMGQIRQQVRQAKAFGSLTGMGSQNMMLQGAAGAQAVQGTPWRSTVGASMYQMGAAQAGIMAQGSAAGAQAVVGAGGIAQAGGALANAQMNALSSGMGNRFAAFIMNPNGTMNEGRLGRVMSGAVSGYDVVSGANQRGYAMGASGRAMFDMYKSDLFNNMSDIERQGVFNAQFDAWGANRYGSTKAKAWVFAGQFTNNIRDQRLVMQSLMSPAGYDVMTGHTNVARLNSMQMANAGLGPGTIMGQLAPQGIMKGIGNQLEAAGDWALNAADQFGTSAMGAFGELGRMGTSMVTGAMRASGLVDQYWSAAGPADLGNRQQAFQIMHGLTQRGNVARGAMLKFSGMGAGPRARISQAAMNAVSGVNFNNMSANAVQTVAIQNAVAMVNGTTKALAGDESFNRMLGLSADAQGFLRNNPEQFAAALNVHQKNFSTTARKEYNQANTDYDKYLNGLGSGFERTKAERQTGQARLDMVNLGYVMGQSDIPRAIVKKVQAEHAFNKTKGLGDINAFNTGLLSNQHSLDTVLKNTLTRSRFVGDDMYGFDVEEAFEDVRGARGRIRAGKGSVADKALSKGAFDIFGGKLDTVAETQMARRDVAAFVEQASGRHHSYMRFAEQRGLKLSEEFRGDLKAVMTGNFKGNAAEWSRQGDNARMLAKLGVGAAATAGLKTNQETAGLLLNNRQVTAMEASERKSDLSSAIRKLTDAILTGEDGFKEGVKVQVGQKEKVVKDKEEAEKTVQLLLANKLAEQQVMQKTEKQGGRTVTLQPPITNYFNNRWAL
jgi:hypothetical protein